MRSVVDSAFIHCDCAWSPFRNKKNVDVRMLLWVLKRKQLVQRMNFYLKVVTSIPGIDNHDANAVNSCIKWQLLFNLVFLFLVSSPKVTSPGFLIIQLFKTVKIQQSYIYTHKHTCDIVHSFYICTDNCIHEKVFNLFLHQAHATRAIYRDKYSITIIISSREKP